jgi:uncharacterized protein YgiM (DUF1202 family)
MRIFRFTLLISLLGLLLALVPGLSAQGGGDNPVAIVAPDFLYLRSNPTTAGSILKELPRGQEVTVLGVERNPNDSGTWVFVQPLGDASLKGWVRSDFLRFPSDFVGLSTLPDVSGTTGSTAATAASGSSTGAAVSVTGGLAGTTDEFANFRTGPELSFDVIEQLPPNTPVIVVGRNANGVWLQVVVEGQVGWLFRDLVRVTGDVNSLPQPSSNSQPAITFTTTTSSTGGTAISIPAANAPRVVGVRPGTGPNDSDGRLNTRDDLGPDLIYCVDGNGYTNAGTYKGGGIVVYNFQSKSVRFFVSEAQIQAAQASRPADSVVASDGVFVMYIIQGNRFSLTGNNQANGLNYLFEFNGCEGGGVTRWG